MLLHLSYHCLSANWSREYELQLEDDCESLMICQFELQAAAKAQHLRGGRCCRAEERAHTHTLGVFKRAIHKERSYYRTHIKIIHNPCALKSLLEQKMMLYPFIYFNTVFVFVKKGNKSMCCRIYTRLQNVPWQALASCVSSGTALLVFVIHSLHTP